MATSGAHTEEAHTRVLPTEPEGDGIGQWEEVEEHSLEEKEEGVCKEQVLTWATSLLVPEGELALLPCQAGEEVRWDRQGEPIEVLAVCTARGALEMHQTHRNCNYFRVFKICHV